MLLGDPHERGPGRDQFTCFTSTIVQKLTRKALLGDPHERGPGRDVGQRAGQVGRAYQHVDIRHKAETASRHKAETLRRGATSGPGTQVACFTSTRGTTFAGFTSTRVQILTPEELRSKFAASLGSGSNNQIPQFFAHCNPQVEERIPACTSSLCLRQHTSAYVSIGRGAYFRMH